MLGASHKSRANSIFPEHGFFYAFNWGSFKMICKLVVIFMPSSQNLFWMSLRFK
jgi:hypothetical protein